MEIEPSAVPRSSLVVYWSSTDKKTITPGSRRPSLMQSCSGRLGDVKHIAVPPSLLWALPVEQRRGDMPVRTAVVFTTDAMTGKHDAASTAVVFPGAAEEESPPRPTQQHEQRLCCRIGPTGSHGALALQVPVSARMHMRPLLHVGLMPDLTLELALGPQPQEAAPHDGYHLMAANRQLQKAQGQTRRSRRAGDSTESSLGEDGGMSSKRRRYTPARAAGDVASQGKQQEVMAAQQKAEEARGHQATVVGDEEAGAGPFQVSVGAQAVGEGGGEGSNKRHCHAPDGAAAGPDIALPRAFGGEAARRRRDDVGMSVEEVGAGLSPPASFVAATAEAARSKPPASQQVPPSSLPPPHSPAAGPPPPPPREPEPAELQAVWRLMLQVPAAQMQAAHALERRQAALAAAAASPATVPAADGGPALSRFRCCLREVVGLLLRARVATLLPATRLSCGPGAGGGGACRCGALRLLGSCAPALPCCCWRSAAHYLVAACEAVADCYGALADAAERDAEEGSGRWVQRLGQEEHKRKQGAGNGEEEAWDEQGGEEEWDDEEEEDEESDEREEERESHDDTEEDGMPESVDRAALHAAGSGGRGTASAAAAPAAVAAGCSAAEQLAGRMEGAVEAVRDVLAEALGRLWRQAGAAGACAGGQQPQAQPQPAPRHDHRQQEQKRDLPRRQDYLRPPPPQQLLLLPDQQRPNEGKEEGEGGAVVHAGVQGVAHAAEAGAAGSAREGVRVIAQPPAAEPAPAAAAAKGSRSDNRGRYGNSSSNGISSSSGGSSGGSSCESMRAPSWNSHVEAAGKPAT